MVEAARRAVAARGALGVDVVVGDASDPPLPSESVDLAGAFTLSQTVRCTTARRTLDG